MAPPMDTGKTRKETDRGRLRDKVAATDPAAAPTYTDAEAADAPTSGYASEASLQRQEAIAQGMKPPSQGPFAATPQPRRRGEDHGGWELAAISAGLVALGVAAGVLGLTGF